MMHDFFKSENLPRRSCKWQISPNATPPQDKINPFTFNITVTVKPIVL